MKTRGIVRNGVSIALILIAAAGCGGQPERGTSAAPAPVARAAAPDTLLADAMRRHNQDPVQALALVAAAADRAPDRTDILWLYIQLCAQASSCQPEDAESRLRRLDPGNAATWLGALSRAQERRDAAAQNEILEAMGRAKRFDIYWNSLVSKITYAAGAAPPSATQPLTQPLTSTMNEAIGWLSAVALPRFKPIGDACLRTTNPATIERCRNVAHALMQGDTVIAERMGLSIAERFATAAGPESAQIARLIARSQYQLETAGQIVASQTEQDKFTLEMLELMSKQRREQDVFEAILRWAGRPMEPAA